MTRQHYTSSGTNVSGTSQTGPAGGWRRPAAPMARKMPVVSADSSAQCGAARSARLLCPRLRRCAPMPPAPSTCRSPGDPGPAAPGERPLRSDRESSPGQGKYREDINHLRAAFKPETGRNPPVIPVQPVLELGAAQQRGAIPSYSQPFPAIPSHSPSPPHGLRGADGAGPGARPAMRVPPQHITSHRITSSHRIASYHRITLHHIPGLWRRAQDGCRAPLALGRSHSPPRPVCAAPSPTRTV